MSSRAGGGRAKCRVVGVRSSPLRTTEPERHHPLTTGPAWSPTRQDEHRPLLVQQKRSYPANDHRELMAVGTPNWMIGAVGSRRAQSAGPAGHRHFGAPALMVGGAFCAFDRCVPGFVGEYWNRRLDAPLDWCHLNATWSVLYEHDPCHLRVRLEDGLAADRERQHRRCMAEVCVCDHR